ncbi:MAG: YwiC-like family protein [bacterium]
MRLKDIPFPKEYGSWGILITSCLIGIFLPNVVFTIKNLAYISGISLLFMTKAPIALLIRRRNKSGLIFTLLYSSLGLFILIPPLLNVNTRSLFILLLIPLLTISVYGIFTFLHRERAFTVEFFAMATLSSPILFFYAIYNRNITGDVILVWLFSFLYFSASIFKVKMLIFEKSIYRVSNIAYLILLFISLFLLIHFNRASWLIYLPFLPLLDNALLTFFHYQERKHLKLVGILELIKGSAFAILLIVITRTALKF